MSQYYYLVTGLPELSLDDNKLNYTVNIQSSGRSTNVVVTDNMAGTLSAKVTGAKSNGTGLDFESFYVCVNVMCVDAEDGTPLLSYAFPFGSS